MEDLQPRNGVDRSAVYSEGTIRQRDSGIRLRELAGGAGSVKSLIDLRDTANYLSQFPITMRWHPKPEGFAGQRLAVVPRPILATALQGQLIQSLMPTDAGFYPKARGHTCEREKGCPETIFIY